jgi:HlyD family secretion protein
MFGKGQDIYRSKALERLSSPEAVDQLLHVVGPRDWLPLLATGLLIAVVLSWSVFGTIPTTVDARGVLVHPHTLVDSQSFSTGRLMSLEIKAGDEIKKGDLIGRLDQSEVLKRLQEDRSMLAELRRQDRTKESLQERLTTLQKDRNNSERTYLELQTQTLTKTVQDIEALRPLLRRRLDGLHALQEQGLISGVSADLLQAEQSVLENETKSADLKARLKQIEGQLKQIDSIEAESTSADVESSTLRQNQIQDLQSRISVAELQLHRSGEIRSEYSGRVIELMATVGQVVETGARLATIALDETQQSLVSISYLPVGDGKKIEPGMRIQVTPDNVERQQYGGVTGVVESVSDLPVTRDAAVLVVGNPAILDLLIPSGPFIQVTSRLDTDRATFTGYKWSSSEGPRMRLSSGLTTSNRITIEQRAPITFIFPFLRSLSGIY